MAQWTETLEPYVKVTERVHTAALNPTAGESLIIGVTLISDAGPAVPTLISNQSEFLKNYSSGDLTESYLASLNNLYTDANNTGDKSVASNMWMNAYRLAGSNTLLVVRASKANDIYYSKPLNKVDYSTYILRDGELMKGFINKDKGILKFVLDIDADDAEHDQDGWSMNINGVGIVGNRTTDEGPQYDYYVNNLKELVEQLNETSKFFSPSYKFFKDERGTEETNDASEAKSVIFYEVYLGNTILDTSDSVRCPSGLQYLITCEPDWTPDNPSQHTIDLNSTPWSGFDIVEYYATNKYNSNTDLRVRIRRFNHDAVVSKSLVDPTLNENSDSPWTVLTSVLDTYTKKGTVEPNESILQRDFYEVAILDPNISDTVQFFNIGKVTGRGDMESDELNSYLSMIQLQLPTNMRDLNLNYYGYGADDKVWVELDANSPEAGSYKKEVSNLEELHAESGMSVGDVYKVGTGEPYKYYQYQENGGDQVYAKLGVDPTESTILNVSESDLMKALDEISIQEVYTVEGLCDLGNTSLSFQNYMANMAINDNYFYPISTVNSTNYMTIANNATKISQDSYKLYMATPWDIDSGTFGWRYYASPAVLYWEAVARNRRNNAEFAPILGQSTGIMQYQRPMMEFNKKTRQLLLSKRVNSVLWNVQTQAWNMNDNYTKQNQDTIMSDEGNSRLAIRISKAMPTLLRQYIGWKISQRLWESATSTIDYWFKTTILPMTYTIDDYRIIIDDTNNPVEIQRQNKMVVNVLVRYQRTLKYVLVYHDIFDVGMDLSLVEGQDDSESMLV